MSDAESILESGSRLLDSETSMSVFNSGSLFDRLEDELISEESRPGARREMREGPGRAVPGRAREEREGELVRHRGRLDGTHPEPRLLQHLRPRRARVEGEVRAVE